MIINALEYLEQAQEKNSQKILYKDETDSITFEEAMNTSKKWGSYLLRLTDVRKPIIVISDKSVITPMLYYAVLYSGCFYVPIDNELPEYRMKLIAETVNAEILIADEKNIDIASKIEFKGKVISTSELEKSEIDEHALVNIRAQVMDVDPAYIIFTSGSTGTPKGVIESHRQLIDYIEAFAETFEISDEDVLGNQSPLDYVAAIRDLYLPLKTGATTVFIPKKYFSMPVKLFECLNENKVTIICWVVGALTLCSEFGVFDEIKPQYLRKVFFTGSVMPCKHLKVWQNNLPGVMFVNHYGPTEITASCTYYIVDHLVTDEETLPIGKAFRNTNILLINEDGKEAKEGELGEIYVRGTSLALGYYKNKEKTKEVFVPNPLNDMYEETVYKTGDLGRLHDGQIEFCGRKDHQIKHMGHRIELGEIENTVISMPEINEAVCLYNDKKQQIWLFFTSNEIEQREIAAYLRKRLPNFMIPRKFVHLISLPKSFNGKVDMKALKEMMS